MAAALLPAKSAVAVDIGSTIVKIAVVDEKSAVALQHFFPRDFECGIAQQVRGLFRELSIDPIEDRILACSSANGGLRVGIVCLTKLFSGAALRNQVLLAGANPLFVHDLESPATDTRYVDILLIGGGIDSPDSNFLLRRIERFDRSQYRFGTLIYCGNRYLAENFRACHPDCSVIDNPLSETLSNRVGSVFETVRRAYLDDLVFKEGVSDLPGRMALSIRPTPEVVSRGFLRSVLNHSAFTIVGASILLDIGGATTDLHYTVEIVDDDSPVRPAQGVSVGRYVFTDIGIVASRETLLMQLRAHPKLYEFVAATTVGDVTATYSAIREGDSDIDPVCLSYGCLFLALDRFSVGKGPGLPVANLDLVAQLILTGGAAQSLQEGVAASILKLFMHPDGAAPLVQVDRRYEIWIAGITWTEDTK